MTDEQAHKAIDDMLVGNQMGDAGSRVVIEEFLTGEEASFIALVDGKNVLALASSQDHKRLLDGDEGPNTGGMGAYSPAPVVTDQIHRAIMEQVIEPTNCRMGDPETQPIMMRLRSDFSAVLQSAVNGELDQVKLDWDPRCAMGVVLAAPGYPASPKTGAVISGLPRDDNNLSEHCVVFHAGTKASDQDTVTSGGRVLCVTALGDTVESARANAYAGATGINFANKQMRSDIGYRAIARSTKAA